MSASRPKKGKIIPRKPLEVPAPVKPKVVAARPAKRQNPALLRQLQKSKAAAEASSNRNGTPSRSSGNASSTSVSGPGTPVIGSQANTPITIDSTDEGEEDDDDEDELEEVEIPAATEGSSTRHATPATPHTLGSTTMETPGALTTDIDTGGEEHYDYADLDDDEETGEPEPVIQLEIGGETPEEKAKRIAMAMRK